MKPVRSTAVLLIAVLLGAGSASLAGPGRGKGRPRGVNTGTYALTVSGFYKGAGTATIHNGAVSVDATVKTGGGAGSFKVNNLTITNGYFKGAGKVSGIDCTVEGRVDLPNAQDDQQNDKQAVTARITGTYRDANGKLGRFVAVQQNPTPGSPGNSRNKGNNK